MKALKLKLILLLITLGTLLNSCHNPKNPKQPCICITTSDTTNWGNQPWKRQGNSIFYNAGTFPYNGKVGIGVLAPQTTLDISSNGNNWYDGGIAFSDANANRFFIFKDLSHALHIGFNGVKFLTLTYGNVGIGTTTPKRKLDVNDAMHLKPLETAPASPTEGDIYMSSVSHKLMVFDGTSWKACW